MQSVDLEKKLDRMILFHKSINDFWNELPAFLFENDKREKLVETMCFSVKEHVISQVLLTRSGHYLSALALFRISYEYLLKAIWIRNGASDEWIEKLFTPHEDELFVGETAKQLSLKELLTNIKNNHPTHISEPLQELYDKTVKAMHSFVHGGIYAFIHTNVPIHLANEKQINMLLNSNILLLLATNIMAMPSLILGNIVISEQFHKIRKEFSDCLPPELY